LELSDTSENFRFMARYFFHVYHDRAEVDHMGQDLPDRYAAWRGGNCHRGPNPAGVDGRLQPDREWRMESPMNLGPDLRAAHPRGEAKVEGPLGIFSTSKPKNMQLTCGSFSRRSRIPSFSIEG
jgi:hypothetical protein